MKELDLLTDIVESLARDREYRSRSFLNLLKNENELMKLVADNPAKDYIEFQKELDEKGVRLNVNKTFEYSFSTKPNIRELLVKGAEDISNVLYDFCFVKANEDNFTELMKKVGAYRMGKIRDKMVLFFFFSKVNKEKNLNLLKNLQTMDYKISKNYLNQIVNRFIEFKGFKKKFGLKEKISSTHNAILSLLNEKKKLDSTKEELKETIQDLRNVLDLVQDELKEYQEEFETFKEEAQLNIIRDFISTQNSDRYGNLLDNFIQCEKKLLELKKKKYAFPDEVESIPILIRQYVKFLRDYGFAEIIKTSVYKLNLDEAKSSEYTGTPFLNKNDVKFVKVLSPGWSFNKEVISIPKYLEINKGE